jgi:ribonuclease HI
MLLDVYTDGSCLTNPGPTGYAFCIKHPKKLYTDSGPLGYGTSNSAELEAIIRALRFTIDQKLIMGYDGIALHTDSMYCVKGATKWLEDWKKRDWVTAPKYGTKNGSFYAVKNKELWIALDEILQYLYVKFIWVKGHAGEEYNELCNTMAHSGASKGVVNAKNAIHQK